MSNINSKGAWTALIFGHMAGMIDLAALPVWVGTLIAGYGFSPAQAGGLATLFLAGVVVSSVVLAPIFHKMNGRLLTPVGFWISTLAFIVMVNITDYLPFAILHVIAGLGTGLAISFTHGTMGKTSNPHRVFAMGGFGLGVLAVAFLGGTPPLIAANGPSTVFIVFAIMMGIAAVLTTLMFPKVSLDTSEKVAAKPFSKGIWLVIIATMGMALNNALILSFAERIGIDSDFGADKVQTALIVMGLMTLLASALAVFLQKRITPLKTAMAGAIIHGLLAVTIMAVPGYWAFILPLAFYPFLMIFTHTFVFGHLAATDPSGRAVAATPAITMTGSMIAPLLGGIILQSLGYAAIGYTALGIAIISMLLFMSARRQG